MFSVIKFIFKAFVILTIYNVCFLGLALFVFLLLMPFSGASKSDLFMANAKPISIGVNVVLMGAILAFFYRKKKGKNVKEKDNPELNKKSNIQKNENTIVFQTDKGELKLTNPFRGIFVVGGAGSGKSESVAVPLLKSFVNNQFCGLLYDFKFPSLANELEGFLESSKSSFKHYYLDFNSPEKSYRVNPLNPSYILNTSYAREYASAIISNLMRESIKSPDYWSRAATDVLTACVWYLRAEAPEICDLPHVMAMITGSDRLLLKTLQNNAQSAQMTVGIYNAMERGSDNQVSGVLGTLQSVIAQINTPEVCWIFGGDDFSLNLNDPANPSFLTVGSYPTLTNTFAPLCSLVITVAAKLMNQQDKQKSFILLDEAPTVYIPNFEIIPNTARSNKVATVFMCQDLAQLNSLYGQDKGDMIFASMNNHFYGRVSSAKTAETLSKQFGKYDRYYVTKSHNSKLTELGSAGKSTSIQQRDRLHISKFLNFETGRFAGVAVESNLNEFDLNFKIEKREKKTIDQSKKHTVNIDEYYRQVRDDINLLFNV